MTDPYYEHERDRAQPLNGHLGYRMAIAGAAAVFVCSATIASVVIFDSMKKPTSRPRPQPPRTRRGTIIPSMIPSVSPFPSLLPSERPSSSPSVSSAPSRIPSEMPSRSPSVTYFCPESAGDSLTVDDATYKGVLAIAAVKNNGNISRLCTLTKRNSVTKVIIPIARSYDGNIWEQAAGPFATKTFSFSKITCGFNIFHGSEICNMELPLLPVDEHYVLTTYERSISQRNEIARFLEQMTFGPTIESIAELEATGADFEQWVADQMALPRTSHRAFWRKRTNPKWTTPQHAGPPDHPCSPDSRWRKYAFTRKDRIDTYAIPPVYRSMQLEYVKDLTHFLTPFQAESASYNSSNANYGNSFSGYSGSGYIEIDGTGPDAYIQWVFESPISDEYTLGFRYSLMTNAARPVDITINGKIVSSSVNLPRTPGWDNWEMYLIQNVTLVSGSNTVRISCNPGTSGPTLDYMRIFSPTILSIDGHVRAVVPAIMLKEDEFADYAFDPNHSYELCRVPYAPQRRFPTGRLRLRIESGACEEVHRELVGNPHIDLTGYDNLASFVFEFDEVKTSSLVSTIDNLDYSNIEPDQEFVLTGGLDNVSYPLCDDIPNIVFQSDAPVFAHLSDDTWIQWDPKLKLEQNTIESPILDGGGKTAILTGDKTKCMNVPRNFLNEDGCRLSTDENTCSLSTSIPKTDIELNYDNVIRFFNLTRESGDGNTRYVYAIRGLVVEASPCNLVTSRWEVLASTNCQDPSNLPEDTLDTFTRLLSDSGDNPFVRDIRVGDEICDTSGFDHTKIEVQVNGDCFKHVHPAHLSVYDVTDWLSEHPGNSQAEINGHEHPIKKWAENTSDEHPGWYLFFPSSHPSDPSFNHPMGRWDTYHSKFDYVGRLGDSVQFGDLPPGLKSTDVASYYDVPLDSLGPGLLVCGSYDEVSNDPSFGSIFDIRSPFQDTTFPSNFARQDEVVWSTISLFQDDQLCQRMAWALAQILVVVTESDMTEPFLGYYDIMVRNCFGNYRDILREISYNPLMAEHLSYLDSRSHAYVYETKGQITYADENFAREIMQLFTIGLVKLNQDGTPRLDSEGKEVDVYSNDDIMSFARAWTGFRRYQIRGNIENEGACTTCNRQDPMFIDKDRRDMFPKSDLLGGYIGDRYPLCEDLPDKMFLRKGAKYRFLGRNPLPELMEDNKMFANDPNIKRMVLFPESALFEKLYNGGMYLNSVVLDDKLDCHFNECKVDTVRTVEVDGFYYEYVRPACVEQAFYEGGKKVIKDRTFDKPNTCANPRLPYAMEACCLPDDVGSKIEATRNYIYDGERMKFDSANRNCAAIGRKLCDFRSIDASVTPEFKTGYHWTTADCSIEVKIDQEGNVAMVYNIENRRGSQALHVSEESLNYFKVYWKNGEYPNASNDCSDATGCTASSGGGCRCETAVSEDVVFLLKPSGRDEILSTLVVGAMNPEVFDDDTFIKQEESDFTAYLVNGVYDSNTIFEVTDDMSRTFFMKNVRSRVSIVGGSFYFRNAPHFMSMLADSWPYGIGETTRRDAEYETEAVLDHYFYHPNMAPFICTYFIKRFGVSNPSPRYVETCSKAFHYGVYASGGRLYGSGAYGDLSALIASISLDREVRTPVLDADPASGSLREPILKVLGLMRALGFEQDVRIPTTQLYAMNEKIGQMAHSFETVFSFFLSEHIPSNGPINFASLTSPESTKLEMPLTVGLLNGIFSLVKYGLSDCNSGFGVDPGGGGCKDDGMYEKSIGVLTFGPTTVFSRVLASSDDAEEELDSGSVSLSSRDLDLGDTSYKSVGVRFTNLQIPKKAKIIGAYIEFEVDEIDSEATSLIIHGQAADSPPEFSAEEYNISSRLLTGAVASWNNIPSWDKISDKLKTPDLSPIVQELVNRNGWVSGNAAVLIFSGTGKRVAESWDGEPDNAPLLVVTYSVDDEPTPTGRSTTEMIDNLATLLTAGRLSTESKKKIVNAVEMTGGDTRAGLRLAEQLIATTPEFHATSLSVPSGNNRQKQRVQSSSIDEYKSLVYLYFDGGCDSFNMLAPHSCPDTIDPVSGNVSSTYEKYLAIREQVALTSDVSLEIDAGTSFQPCTSFGIHPSLPILRDLYNENAALFVANTGLLLKPVDKTNYKQQTPTQLFAHNTMSRETKQVDLNEEVSGTGVVGRLNDALVEVGYSTSMFSISGNTITLAGQPGANSSQSVLRRTGLDPFNPEPAVANMEDIIKDLNNATKEDCGFMSETWASELYNAMDQHSTLYSALEQVSTKTVFPDTKLGKQLSTVAELMQTHKQRGTNRDLFYISIGGFDTHSDVGPSLVSRFDEVNIALDAFVNEMKAQDLWANTTLVQFSDFARTLRPNSGNGTDHGWGQNIFAVGGSLKGGKVLGDYPSEFSEESAIGLTRGRLIPTTPFDSIWNGIAQWYGVTNESALRKVLPMRRNFPPNLIFNISDLYV